jgi:tRNA dimethylallyltransferase
MHSALIMVDPCRTRTGGGFDHAVRQQEIAGREAGIENAAHHGNIAADHFDFQHRSQKSSMPAPATSAPASSICAVARARLSPSVSGSAIRRAMSTETSLSCSDQTSHATGSRPRLALIAGPTASGKSDLAVRLALAEQAAGRAAVVINADSAQVYADLAVLSARPSAEDMQGVPHRLFGAWDGAQACSAADWAQAARAEIEAAHAAGALPILVGGTGLYIRTLLDGIAPIPAIDPAVRAAVRALPVEQAHAALAHEDPDRAAALHPADTTRVARALEVVRSTGHPLAHWQARREGGIGHAVALRPLVLLPDRAWLYARCDLRFARMWEAAPWRKWKRCWPAGSIPICR